MSNWMKRRIERSRARCQQASTTQTQKKQDEPERDETAEQPPLTSQETAPASDC